MLYEIVNPSDAYTMEAPDEKTAAFSVGLLSPMNKYFGHERYWPGSM